MIHRSRMVQMGFLLAAAACLIAAGLMLRPLERASKPADLLTTTDVADFESNPELGLLTAMPGGLRVLAVNYLWIRAQDAHQEGRHYDALQLSELICQLQPHQPSVWIFHAWNMSYNISVTCDTADARWQWVYNGIKLLRDRAIRLNPRSLPLYKELAWIFFNKMGGQLDDMHWSYKRRWGGQMQSLLGAPPHEDTLKNTLGNETQVVIDAFRVIAEAPLDKTPRLQGLKRIQSKLQAKLLAEPDIAAYANLLAPHGIHLDDTLLEAYNRYSLAYPAAAVRIVPPRLPGETEKNVSALINDPKYGDRLDKETGQRILGPLTRMLAFVRAQILWNQYRMDPAYMLTLMERYEIPMDWRHTTCHSLYWASYGIDVCRPDDKLEVATLNNMRNVLNSMKYLTGTGLVAMQTMPDMPLYPRYYESPDMRYVKPTDDQHRLYIDELLKQGPGEFYENELSTGHQNYLRGVMTMLVADGRIREAQGYYDAIKKDYKKSHRQWKHVSVEDFVAAELEAETGPIRYMVAQQLVQVSMKRAYLARGLADDSAEYAARAKFALRVYQLFQKAAVKRMHLAAFEDIAANTMIRLLGQPRSFGLSLTVAQRSDIYLAMGDQPKILVRVYHRLERLFQNLAKADGLDPAKAFPAPAGLTAYRKSLRETMKDRDPAQNK